MSERRSIDIGSDQEQAENLASPEEAEKYTSRVLLHFIRHGEKESDPNKLNRDLLLTPKGRQQGLEKGLSGLKAKPSAMAFGSSMLRAQEMAGLQLAGAQRRDDITGEESFDELRAKVNEGVWGTKFASDPRLSFHFDTPEFEAAAVAAYKKGRSLKFTVEESDQLAEKLNDQISSSYSHVSAEFARVIDKYFAIAPRFDKIVSDSGKKDYYSDTLERFMGSHAGALDVFLCKVVEKVKGVDERNKLVAALGNDAFDFAESFDVEIDMIDGQPQLRIRYQKEKDNRGDAFVFDEAIPYEIIQKIIEEGGPMNVAEGIKAIK